MSGASNQSFGGNVAIVRSCSRLCCATGFTGPSASLYSSSESYLKMVMGLDYGGRLPYFDLVGVFCLNFALFDISFEKLLLKL